MKRICLYFLLLAASFAASLTICFAQPGRDAVKQLIFKKDSTFWVAYNNCDIAGMEALISNDVEFYHDKGGITYGLAEVTKTMKNNLCSNPDFRLRREAVKGTVEVFPLAKNDTIYGAIISGQHYFYINEKGKKEFRDGLAKFSQLWLIKDGVWKMHRILSYDHQPAPYENTRSEIKIADNILDRYVGRYKASLPDTLIVFKNDKLLHLTVGKDSWILHPQSETVFFLTERDLEFEFSKNILIVREHGKEVDRGNKL
jgi:hypothetical protein